MQKWNLCVWMLRAAVLRKSLMVWQWFGGLGGNSIPPKMHHWVPQQHLPPFFVTQQCECSKCKLGFCRMGAETSDLHNEYDDSSFVCGIL